MIEILNSARLERARGTGALVGDILHTLKQRSVVGTNLLDIDQWAKEMITEAGAQSCYVDYAPSFGRGPFGHYICTAVNDGVLHGRPHNYTLADGDLLIAHVRVIGQWPGGVHRQALVSGSCDDLDGADVIATFEPLVADHNGWFEWQGTAFAPEPELEGSAWVVYGVDQGDWNPALPAACADLALP